jgi:hypothetical protein
MTQDHDGEAKPAPPSIALSGQTFREVFGLAGSGLAGYGAWLHYQPLGFVVGGALMVALAIVGTMKDRG